MNKMVSLIIVGAGLLAIATYLIITSITESPPPTEQTATTPDPATTPAAEIITIGDTAIALHTLPHKQIRLPHELQAQPTPTSPAALTPFPPTPQSLLPTPSPPPAAQVTFADYTVQPGDTLFSLAQRFNTTIELMAQHNIAAGNIVVGTQLRIPIPNTAQCAGGASYVVQPGDTVFSIARRHGTDVETVRAMNNLGPDYLIKVNQLLCLP